MFGIKIDNCLWMSGMCVVLLGNFSLFGTVLQEGPPAGPRSSLWEAVMFLAGELCF